MDTKNTNRNAAAILVVSVIAALSFVTGRHSVSRPVETSDPANGTETAAAVTDVKASAVTTVQTGVASSQPKAANENLGWDEQKWSVLCAQPHTPAGNALLADMLEKLASQDPDRAMKLAQAEGNLKLKEVLVQSALHGWARTSPTNAANWALALTDSNGREQALSSVFDGAVAANPATALEVGKFIIAANPDEATGYGARLIDALCAAGDFSEASQMVAGGDAQTRAAWAGEAYSKWAEMQPDQAAQAAAAITDPDARNEALHGIVGGWAEADPAALVQFVTQLPADAGRDSLVSQSLERWAKIDPKSAADWINSQPTGTGLDQGVAAVATTQSLPPETAAEWAEYVTDPKLRSQTLVTVLRNWITVDAAAAQNYFNNTTDLTPEDREEITDVIKAMQGNIAAQ
jgi:hypothetical protein